MAQEFSASASDVPSPSPMMSLEAETLYGLVAANPVFFKWSDDPEAEVRPAVLRRKPMGKTMEYHEKTS
jgi:hypothetical protein